MECRLVEEATVSVTTGRTMEQVAEGTPPEKDAKAKTAIGAVVKTKAAKLVPKHATQVGKTANAAGAALGRFVPLMLCTLVERPPEDPEVGP